MVSSSHESRGNSNSSSSSSNNSTNARHEHPYQQQHERKYNLLARLLRQITTVMSIVNISSSHRPRTRGVLPEAVVQEDKNATTVID